MARKVYVNVTTRLIINLEDEETVEDVIQEMDYDFSYSPDGAENRITDTEILWHEITDSK